MNTLKNSTLALFLLTFAFAFTSCDDEVLRGHGDTVSRTRPVANYEAVSLGGNFEVYLSQGPTKDIILEGQENVLTEVTTEVRGSKLYIKYDKNRVKVNQAPRIYLTTPNLNEVSVSGANSVKGLTDWQVENFKLRTSGSGSINLNIKSANKIESHISGSANITLTGDAKHHEMNISGSGQIKTFDLAIKTADIKVSGSGRCEVNVAEHLKADISGSGKIRYKGSPVVNSKISGSGSVFQAN
ncbi:head GIN domain-containing protein [Adhaeribacter aquaticus]|uniref:head GIN domain-containing protein n=1 Tax=Adhaeribacter aquaticus TaxID=299567 RepID=UPI0004104DA9|nr:head GIN domain-containing protein [Adhaeribacter aquaticus]